VFPTKKVRSEAVRVAALVALASAVRIAATLARCSSCWPAASVHLVRRNGCYCFSMTQCRQIACCMVLIAGADQPDVVSLAILDGR
jgi:hypothetical protein